MNRPGGPVRPVAMRKPLKRGHPGGHLVVLARLLCMPVIKQIRFILTLHLSMPHQRSFMMRRNKACAVSAEKRRDIFTAAGAIPILLKQKKRLQHWKHSD